MKRSRFQGCKVSGLPKPSNVGTLQPLSLSLRGRPGTVRHGHMLFEAAAGRMSAFGDTQQLAAGAPCHRLTATRANRFQDSGGDGVTVKRRIARRDGVLHWVLSNLLMLIYAPIIRPVACSRDAIMRRLPSATAHRQKWRKLSHGNRHYKRVLAISGARPTRWLGSRW